MDVLRTILIIIGVILIAGIYLAEPLKRRWEQWQEQRAHNKGHNDQTFDSDEALGLRPSREEELPDEWVGSAYIVNRDDSPSSDALDDLKGMGRGNDPLDVDLSLRTDDSDPELERKPATAPKQPDEVIVLTLMAQKGKRLRGPVLLKALQDADLAHGEMQIFHYTPEGHPHPLFSVANILEPGHFVMSEMVEMETPGVALFMQLPAAIDGAEAWAAMHQRAAQMAKVLKADLCDAQRRPLDEEGLLRLEQQAAGFKAV